MQNPISTHSPFQKIRSINSESPKLFRLHSLVKTQHPIYIQVKRNMGNIYTKDTLFGRVISLSHAKDMFLFNIFISFKAHNLSKIRKIMCFFLLKE